MFFQQKDLPADRSQWKPIFLGALGSPDPHGRQLDGLGGGLSSVSKVCVVGPSSHPDADVDYTFAAIGVRNDEVDFSSNCGNMTSAVGPFAIDSGMLSVSEDGDTTVRIHNTNTGKIINSIFPVKDGEAEATGNFSIDGVSGTAARVCLDFVDPTGSKTGRLLPTGNVVDQIDGLPVTCIDVGNPCCFVKADDLNVDGDMTPDQIEQHPSLLQRLDSIRRDAGVKMRLAASTEEVPGSVPKVCMVSQAGSDSGSDVRVRAISVGQPHKAVPITVAMSVSAAAELSGSVVNTCTREKRINSDGIVINHASGKLMVGSKFDESDALKSASVFRTARRLMDGTVYWR